MSEVDSARVPYRELAYDIVRSEGFRMTYPESGTGDGFRILDVNNTTPVTPAEYLGKICVFLGKNFTPLDQTQSNILDFQVSLEYLIMKGV